MSSLSTATLTDPAELDGYGNGPAAASVLFVRAPHDHADIGARLAGLGLTVTPAADPADALRLLKQRSFTMALVHLADERVALPAVRAIRTQQPHLLLAGLMDPSRPLVAAEAIRAGVAELLTWPLDDHDVAAIVVNARDRMGVAAVPPVNGHARDASAMLFANSPAMRTTMERLRAAAGERCSILLTGERGSGRELVARTIHARSGRADRPFVTVDCASGTLHELEVRLFGVVTDRRTGGNERRGTERVGVSGALYRANGGTLFLRGVADAPTRVQAKLARLLRDCEAGLAEERTVIDLEFRVVAAIDAGPAADGIDERMRHDLLERVSQVQIDIPPFRKRREDVPLIAVSLLPELCEKYRVPHKTCSRAALALLAALPWPGNGRELRALLETLVRSVPRPVIQLDDLFEHVRLDGLAARVEAGGTLRDARASFERDWISAVLMKHHGRVGEAAKALGIQRTNLYRKVRQLKVARTLLGPKKASRQG